jgi:sugar O-acyltransferase (sialic acid O-acetyltransferase NeuD family)
MKKNIVIIGGGNQASYSIEIIELLKQYNIVGIIDSANDVGTNLHGYNVIGRQNEIINLVQKYNIDAGFIAVGDNWSRKVIYEEIIGQIPSFDFVTLVHPTVIIGKNVEIGIGSLIMAGVIVNINSKIGKFGFLATGAQIDHDCILEDFTSVSAGSVFGGMVKLKKYGAVTLGATILDRITIGENSVIGAGAVVTQNIGDNIIAYGIPAKPIRKRELGEKFLK